MRQMHTGVVLMLALTVGQVHAQMPKPAAGPERARMGFLVGSFTTEVKVSPSPMAPNGATGTGTSVITWALDSMFVLIDEQGMNSLFGRYQGHGVLGFDANTHEYMLFMFSNFGDHPSYKGDFVGDTLVLATKVPMPGREFDQKLVWFKDGSSVKLRVLNDLGKGFDLAVEQTATRVP